MALAIGAIEPHRLYFCKTLPLFPKPFCCFSLFYYYYSPLTLPSRTCERFSTESNSGVDDFPGKNAYDVLGVSESSSLAEIKASFLKLAKETHPDVAAASDSTASQRFVQILAAYEILSDSEKRAHYDQYLFTQKKIVQKQSKQGSGMYRYMSHVTKTEQIEVVEWLKWYRCAINDIISQEKVVVGSGYFDILESEFYSAIHRAYYGPLIESMDLLPDRFEAEERSAYDIPEVLHLVSGRDLFGIVCLVDKAPELSHASFEKLTHFTSMMGMKSEVLKHAEIQQTQVRDYKDFGSDAYKDLELHISGTVVAVATRIPPKRNFNGIQNQDSQDHIHVFLNLDEDGIFTGHSRFPKPILGSSDGSRIFMGTISGLRTNPEESSCFVYNNCGTKTHVLMKHRTLLVKHMHWYRAGDEVSPCECRCSRARLPSSKFWLFEPRCSMHDIGGWYVETFGRDKKGRTIPSQRQWDGTYPTDYSEKRLHPAMYLLALAYRTLDLEDAKRRKHTVRDILEPKLFTLLQWCKKLL
ncbi:DnaJ domain-containing protein [Cinnamomum micranthum f. kanehirae]|uniref:DnaJ domain-containing protein n=1 Tax=Cinnamomum micranthum f. kanehirae TaxID=337451 RepID=A0A3S3MXI0_9MAGN|nr:DnaJ domain-containing protein [Cinnamomum micranthum f. kanehirae]